MSERRFALKITFVSILIAKSEIIILIIIKKRLLVIKSQYVKFTEKYCSSQVMVNYHSVDFIVNFDEFPVLIHSEKCL